MKKNIENSKAQMRRGILEFCILSIIDREGELYPSDIIGELQRGKMTVVEGTIYPLLTRLKTAHLLAYTWKESEKGPPRKYYRLTEDGQSFRQELRTTWEDLVKSVNLTTQNQPIK